MNTMAMENVTLDILETSRLPVRWVEHRNKKVLFIDLRQTSDEPAMLRCFEEARRLGLERHQQTKERHPVLVDFSGVDISEALLETVKTSGREASQRTGRMAAVGLDGIKRIFLTAFNLFTGHQARAFDKAQLALDWLCE